ncbi:DUF3322 domain-containing protein [Salinisphaera sp.]|uniref:DUF3322 domain-containing protein n=1 Tax=Salinisphaera sp. TaxID=1914330 RepID=UPI002D781AFF|nr:DUF3322 domain-containing protein [Salinisphaera sp.]HET7313779.1 DUF3322 domain-containing protein [Salinisphaera sp.]
MADPPPWTTPADLRAQLERRWARGELLAARVTGESLFPLALRLKNPSGGDIARHFDAVRAWIDALRQASAEARGFGYTLTWQSVRNRVHGANDVPTGASVATAEDGLKLIGRSRDAARFDSIIEQTRENQPTLLDWLARRPLTALEHADDWPRLLTLVDWFVAHPRPGCYRRQLDIAGVDTKFIETRRRVIGELLDLTLPAAAIDAQHTGAAGFDARYGLRGKPPRLRFRLLDSQLAIAGLTDLAVPAAEFAGLTLDRRTPTVETVFITENEINGLAFPPVERALVIFGLGYALDALADIAWLHRVAVYYWGDLDTHGFAMLDRLRRYLPHAESLLMDRATFDAYLHLAGNESAKQRFTGTLTRLTMAEQELFETLRDNALADNLRLEQEHIGFGWVEARLRELAHRPGLAADH